MSARFDRWTALAGLILGTVLWVAFPILKSYGLSEGSLWGAMGGLIALAAGSLSIVQLLRQRRRQDRATELRLK